jgi:gingipain R
LRKAGFIFFSIVVFLLVSSLVLAGGKRGAKDFDLTITEDTTRGGRISARIKAKRAFSVGLTQRQNKEYQTVSFESCLPTKEKGFPEVSYFRMVFQLRNNQNYELVVKNQTFDALSYEGEWLPSRGQILRTVDPATVPYKMDNAALADTDYPGSEFVVLGDPFLIREVRGIDLTIYPVLINTVQKQVKILRSIEFELVPVEEEIGLNQQPQRVMKIFSRNEPVLNALFDNFRWTGELDDDLGHMLVIYTPEYKNAIQPFISHKKSLGFTVTEEEVAKGTHVKSIIQEAYDADHDLLYVQLVGDWEDIQCEKMAYDGSECVNSDGCPEDNALGLVSDGDDYYDLIISRFSAGDATDVTTQVNRVIAYETNTNQTWWKKALGIASAEGGVDEGDDGESDKEHLEIIKTNKLLPAGYTVYDEYDPTGTVSGVSSAVNEGVQVINYVGHGWTFGWSSPGRGFSSSNVNALTNASKVPFIFSVACSVGEYNGETCFAESWLRKTNGGAVSAVMSTISQPWDPPMRGQDYMNDLLTGGYDYAVNPGTGISTDYGKTRLGSIVFNAFNLQIAEAGREDVATTKTWVLFGDGSLQVVGGGASPCPDCSGDEKVLENITFTANSTCTCTGSTSLTLGDGVRVESDASVIFQAPVVKIISRVTLEEGSHVEIRN